MVFEWFLLTPLVPLSLSLGLSVCLSLSLFLLVSISPCRSACVYLELSVSFASPGHWLRARVPRSCATLRRACPDVYVCISVCVYVCVCVCVCVCVRERERERERERN